MKIAAGLLSRGCFLALLLLTSFYCLLAYVPFTYQQVLKSELLNVLVVFSRIHIWLYWLAFGFLATTVRLKRWLLAGLALIGVVLLFRPLLPNLENNEVSYYLSLLSLVPLLAVAILDSSAGYANRAEAPLIDHPRAFSAAWQSALLLSVLYAGIATLRDGERSVAEGAVTLLWSLAYHLVFFGAFYVALNWIWAAALVFPHPQRVQFVLFHAFGAVMIWLAFRLIVFPPITFEGLRAEVYGAALGVTMSAFVAGIRLRAEPRPSRKGWVAGIVSIAVVALAGAWLAIQTARMDWNFLLQKLTVTAVWLAMFLVLYRTPLRIPAMQRSIPATLLIALAVAIGFRTLQATPLRETHLRLLDRYAGYNASFRLLRDVMAPPTAVDDEAFYRFLSQNTNISRAIQVAPAPVNLVERMEPTTAHTPNIFIFVIDSLRRDYLSPYNGKVKFTPRIGDFAHESVVMTNAFTRYGGTGLSEPSIWVGGMMLHKQYVTPFAPMNSLEKLIQASGYVPFVSRDSILSTILGKWSSGADLDASRAGMNYDFPTSLKELENRIGASPKGPYFAYTQPQNIHISVIQREKESVLPGGNYDGFYAPYASRLARMDAAFGEFIQFLKARGLYDDSIVILTADHGDSLGEEGRWGHAYTIYPEILRIPLIIHLPPAMRDRLAYDPDELAFSTDITPSLYYLLGHRPIQPNAMFGRPLFTQNRDEQKPYGRDDYLVASSYAAVYGILGSNGRRLYIADAANHRDFAFDLSSGSSPISVSDSMRSSGQEQIRKYIFGINDFYRFHPTGSGETAAVSR